MSHNPEKYFWQCVLDIKDGTVLPFSICCSLHKAFTEGSTPLLCHYFNNQTSQSSIYPLLIFHTTITFSEHSMQCSGCTVLRGSYKSTMVLFPNFAKTFFLPDASKIVFAPL